MEEVINIEAMINTQEMASEEEMWVTNLIVLDLTAVSD